MRSLLLAACSLALLANGCFTTRLRDTTLTPGPQQEEWRSFFFWGLVGKAEIDVRELCHGDVYEVATGTNAATSVVTGLTLGIYSPEKIYIRCADTSEIAVGVGTDGRPERIAVREGGRLRVGEPVRGKEPGAYDVTLRDVEGGAK